jgi:hypothetical protein
MHSVSFMHGELSNVEVESHSVEVEYFKVKACFQHAWKFVVQAKTLVKLKKRNSYFRLLSNYHFVNS